MNTVGKIEREMQRRVTAIVQHTIGRKAPVVFPRSGGPL